MVSTFRQKALTNLGISLARDNLPGLVSNLASNPINKFERKKSVKEDMNISNDDMNDIIKIIKSLEDSNVLIDGITEKVKNEIKNKKTGF